MWSKISGGGGAGEWALVSLARSGDFAVPDAVPMPSYHIQQGFQDFFITGAGQSD